jgi:hypothetical protein
MGFITNEAKIISATDIVTSWIRTILKSLRLPFKPWIENKYGKLRLRKLIKSISKTRQSMLVVANLPIDSNLKVWNRFYTLFKHKIPMWILDCFSGTNYLVVP